MVKYATDKLKFGKWCILYGLVVVELAALTGSYYVWHNMNTKQCKYALFIWLLNCINRVSKEDVQETSTYIGRWNKIII